MSGWAKMVIWDPCCISFSVSNKDLGTGVGNNILTQEQGNGKEPHKFTECETEKNQSPANTTKLFIFLFEKDES